MKIEKNLMYTKSHEWAEFIDATTAKVGLSDYAQHALDSLVFVSLPEIDDAVTAGEAFGDVESVKAVSDVYSPVSGVVTKINEDLLDTPGNINDDPYGSWMIVVSNISSKAELMDADAYAKYCEECDA